MAVSERECRPCFPAGAVLWIVLCAVAYFLAHGIACLFPGYEQRIAVLWPAGGVGLAVLLLSPYRLWPVLVPVVFLADLSADVLLMGRSVWVGIGYTTAHMVESLGCASLIIAWCGKDVRFTRTKEVLALVTSAACVTVFSASIGAGVDALTQRANFGDVWLSWYLADGLGMLLLTPFLIAWSECRSAVRMVRPARLLEWAVFMVLWCIVAWLSFEPKTYLYILTPHPYMLVALLIWPALRMGQREVTLAILVLAGIAITSRGVHAGPLDWGDGSLAERMLMVQVFLAFIATTGYLLTAVDAEKRSAQEALGISEERLRLATRATNDVVWDWDVVHDLQLWNEAGTAVFGWSDIVREPQTAVWWTDRVHPDDRERVGRGFHAVVDDPSRSHWRDEYRFRKADGSYAMVLDRGYVMRDQQGRAVRMIGAMLDITERKRSEELLRRERALLSGVMDATDVMLVYLDCDFNFVWVNAAYAATCRMQPEELVGRNHFAMYPNAENEAVFRRVCDTGESVFFKDKPFTFPDQPERGVTYWDWSLVAVKEPSGETRGLVFSLRETTGFRRTELALQESERRFRALFDSMFQFIGLLSPDGTLLEANQAALEAAGIRLEDVQNRPFWKCRWWTISPETQEQLRTAIERAARGEFIRYEVDLRGAGDRVIPVDFSLKPVMDSSGNVILLVPEGRDITERRQAEETLRASQAQLQAVIDHIDEGIVICDMEGRLLHWNPAALAMHGFSTEDEARRRLPQFADLFELSTMDGRSLPVEQWPLARLLRNEPLRNWEIRIRRLSGNWERIFSYGGTLVPDAQGCPVMAVVTLADITERKRAEESLRQSEEQFRQLAETIREVFWLVSPDWRNVLYISPAYEEVWGRSRESLQASPPSWFDAVVEEDRPALQVDIERKIAGDFSRPEFPEYRIVRPDGSVRWILARAFPIQDADGKVCRIAGIAEDITDRKNAEHRLQMQLQELQRWHAVTLGREGRIQELKCEINDVLKAHGEAARYASVESQRNAPGSRS